jgi:hypothetical protein
LDEEQQCGRRLLLAVEAEVVQIALERTSGLVRRTAQHA